MTIIHLFILSIVQGIAEFLPISSSAHLILVPVVMGEADQGVLLDVAAHVGTLAAVITYFWSDFKQLVAEGIDIIAFKKTANKTLAFYILIGTIPAVIAGGILLLTDVELFRHLWIIVVTNFVFAGLLWGADKFGKTTYTLDNMGWKHALIIGIAQTIAIIPGTSRSGITMTTSRFLGYTRTEAARFSMLLSIPVIILAGLAAFVEILTLEQNSTAFMDVLIVLVCSALTGIGAIHFLMHWLKKYSFMPFVIYRFTLGSLVLLYLIQNQKLF